MRSHEQIIKNILSIEQDMKDERFDNIRALKRGAFTVLMLIGCVCLGVIAYHISSAMVKAAEKKERAMAVADEVTTIISGLCLLQAEYDDGYVTARIRWEGPGTFDAEKYSWRLSYFGEVPAATEERHPLTLTSSAARPEEEGTYVVRLRVQGRISWDGYSLVCENERVSHRRRLSA